MQTVSGILCSVFNKSFPQCNSSPNTNSQKAISKAKKEFTQCLA